MPTLELLRAVHVVAATAVEHVDPSAQIALWLALILIAAKLGGDLATRVGQPAVLGELLAGIAIGNLHLFGIAALDPVVADPTIDMLARIGVLILLFEVGLESTVAQMMKVGWSSLLVATLGVIAPFALGWGVGALLMPQASFYVHMFLGATLTATSVGITARVFKDLGKAQTAEARVILGAAVIDDVLGLVVLAAVAGMIGAANAGQPFAWTGVAWIVVKALLFLGGALVFGALLSRRLFSLASHLRARGVLLALGLSFCFVMAWLSGLIGLAPIVGAFAAGLLLEETHYRDFVDQGEHPLEELIHPISSFLVPIFFVVMGARTDLRTLANPDSWLLTAGLIVAAVVGKQVCSLGVIGRGIDRLTIGLGMIPRGEVGLIFASIGVALTVGGERIIDAGTYSAVVAMVIVTTLVTPPLIKWRLAHLSPRQVGP